MQHELKRTPYSAPDGRKWVNVPGAACFLCSKFTPHDTATGQSLLEMTLDELTPLRGICEKNADPKAVTALSNCDGFDPAERRPVHRHLDTAALRNLRTKLTRRLEDEKAKTKELRAELKEAKAASPEYRKLERERRAHDGQVAHFRAAAEVATATLEGVRAELAAADSNSGALVNRIVGLCARLGIDPARPEADFQFDRIHFRDEYIKRLQGIMDAAGITYPEAAFGAAAV